MCSKQRGVMGQTTLFGVRWCQESRGRASTESPLAACGAVGQCVVMARGHDRAEGLSFPGAQHGVTRRRGSPAPPNPHGALTPSVHAADHTCTNSPVHRHPCAHTAAHHSTSPGESRSLAPHPRAGPLSWGWDFKPTRIRTFRLCPPCTGFTDSLETVTGAGKERSIKQRAAARAGDSNNKSCCVQWLKLVFKKCPEKKVTPPKTRVGPIAANNQQD